MGELNYYQRSRDVLLNKSKEYYRTNRERIRNKSLSEDKKIIEKNTKRA